MAGVIFEQIDKLFAGGVYALRDFDLRIADGELLVCVGPSGCGKSTALRLAAGLEEATRGVVRIGDRVVNGLPPQQRNVAMVFQDYALYPYLTVRGNLEFPLKMRRLPRSEARRRVNEVAAMLGLSELLERLPKHLSGGQRQRVAMGRALVREPTVFLLDEPLSNLDARLRTQVRAEIGELQQRTGATMIYVTHDQVEAMTLGQRVAVLDRGRLRQVAPPAELYAHPANTFVAGFIGNPPMNLFMARLLGERSQRLALDVSGQRLPLDHDSRWELLRPWVGHMLTVGVRPEALRLTAEHGLAARMVDAEYLGHETLLKAQLEAAPGEAVELIVRLPGLQAVTRGALARLQFAPERLYLFDPAGTSLST